MELTELERVAATDLVLRAFTPADEAALRALFADEQTAVWNPGPADGDVTAWWRGRNDWSGGGHASWGIAAADGGALLGSVSVHKINPDQQDAEIGYQVVPAARGRGIAGRAVEVATRFAFERLGLHRLQLVHATGNPASCRVAARAGFRLEGVLRESYRYADGRWHDEHLHARLASDPPGPVAAGA